ncbi:hypothetical protein [Nocardia yunnanensis]|uniref:hypothetical protein n=1 Tax=Nocardia yunnanensis TaxID=2382165 RepID=UPI0013C41038|nr:hypothetical protein [Nocardia yunnanensis]
MGIILAITLISLLLFVTTVAIRAVEAWRHPAAKLTVAAIKARLDAEPPRTYVPISRGW